MIDDLGAHFTVKSENLDRHTCEVVNEPRVGWLNVGLESGEMLMTVNFSKGVLPGVLTPAPLITIVWFVDSYWVT